MSRSCDFVEEDRARFDLVTFVSGSSTLLSLSSNDRMYVLHLVSEVFKYMIVGIQYAHQWMSGLEDQESLHRTNETCNFPASPRHTGSKLQAFNVKLVQVRVGRPKSLF